MSNSQKFISKVVIYRLLSWLLGFFGRCLNISSASNQHKIKAFNSNGEQFKESEMLSNKSFISLKALSLSVFIIISGISTAASQKAQTHCKEENKIHLIKNEELTQFLKKVYLSNYSIWESDQYSTFTFHVVQLEQVLVFVSLNILWVLWLSQRGLRAIVVFVWASPPHCCKNWVLLHCRGELWECSFVCFSFSFSFA